MKVPASTLRIMRNAARSTVLLRHTYNLVDLPVKVAGKSGTAELDGGATPHAWFIGFAPVDDPQVAIAVVVEGGGRGGERAAPLAGRMLALALAELGG